MTTRHNRAASSMGVGFLVAGVAHFVKPAFFDAIMPRIFPTRTHRPIVYASGVLELICGVGLLRRTRWAAPASVALLVGVFPANLQMALDAGSGRYEGAMDTKAVAWGRLPLQAVMIWSALQGRPSRSDPTPATR